jgi:hypothetical protein
MQIMKKKLKIVFDVDRYYRENTNESMKANHIYYETINKIYTDIKKRIIPLAYVVKLDNKVMCLVTLGIQYDIMKREYFADNNYLKGYYFNEMADVVLFNATTQLYNILQAEFFRQNMYLSKRTTLDNEFELKKQVLEEINNQYDTKVSITEAFMLNPVKSLIYLYHLQYDVNGIDIDCKDCGQQNCKYN